MPELNIFFLQSFPSPEPAPCVHSWSYLFFIFFSMFLVLNVLLMLLSKFSFSFKWVLHYSKIRDLASFRLFSCLFVLFTTIIIKLIVNNDFLYIDVN